MAEQVSRIEEVRHRLERRRHEPMVRGEATREWIKRFSDHFPPLLVP